jgi:hypothetical protein
MLEKKINNYYKQIYIILLCWIKVVGKNRKLDNINDIYIFYLFEILKSIPIVEG